MGGKTKLMGLWVQTSSNGGTYLSGTIGGIKVLIFPNQFKTADNQPDHVLFIAPKEETQPAEYQAPAPAPAPAQTNRPAPAPANRNRPAPAPAQRRNPVTPPDNAYDRTPDRYNDDGDFNGPFAE